MARPNAIHVGGVRMGEDLGVAVGGADCGDHDVARADGHSTQLDIGDGLASSKEFIGRSSKSTVVWVSMGRVLSLVGASTLDRSPGAGASTPDAQWYGTVGGRSWRMRTALRERSASATGRPQPQQQQKVPGGNVIQQQVLQKAPDSVKPWPAVRCRRR
ncbi:hypothetical protein GCM10028781_01250 [Nostocoides australiense]